MLSGYSTTCSGNKATAKDVKRDDDDDRVKMKMMKENAHDMTKRGNGYGFLTFSLTVVETELRIYTACLTTARLLARTIK